MFAGVGARPYSLPEATVSMRNWSGVGLCVAMGCVPNTSGIGAGNPSSLDTTDSAMTTEAEATLGATDGATAGTSTSGRGGSSGPLPADSSGDPPTCESPTLWFLDADGDGFGDDQRTVRACEAPDSHVAMGGDCNDAAASAYPEADEICDTLDNDCDGDTDEWAPSNEGECNGCLAQEQGGQVYYLCLGAVPLEQGEAVCLARGADVASIGSDLENDTIRYMLEVFEEVNFAYIGYSDAEREGVWRWTDGAANEFEQWASGQPDNIGGQDCAVIQTGTGLWYDRLCSNLPAPNEQSDAIVCRDLTP